MRPPSPGCVAEATGAFFCFRRFSARPRTDVGGDPTLLARCRAPLLQAALVVSHIALSTSHAGTERMAGCSEIGLRCNARVEPLKAPTRRHCSPRKRVVKGGDYRAATRPLRHVAMVRWEVPSA